MIWTEENFNMAKQLQAKKITASKNARQLATTKNAVLGKLYRAKLKKGYVPKKITIISRNLSTSYFKKIGTSICILCHKTYDIFSIHDRFCSGCKRSELYRSS